MKRFTRKAWLAIITVIAMLVTLVPTGLALTPSPSSLGDDEAIVMLQAYGIVKGDETGNLRLDENITRAQAAAIFVRAMGSSELATMLQNVYEFNDTRGHWANGEITMAHRLGLMQGADGNFRPNDNITYAELMTVMLRMVGQEPAGPWNARTIMQAAQTAGIAPASTDIGLLANLPAQRGRVFKSLAVTISAIPLPTGETLLKKNLDKTPPQVTVDPVPGTSTTGTVTITGTTKDAWKVTVNGQEAAMSGNRFSATVTLAGGSNNIEVQAFDYAGNVASKTVTVAMGGNPARIDVTGPASVQANGTITVRATAYDANGVALPASAVTAQVSGNIGVYDAASGQFRAGATVGTGSITFTAGTVTKVYNVVVTGLAQTAKSLRVRPVNNGQLLTTNRFTTVTVEVLDADGNAIAYDGGRNITLAASPSGLNVAAAVVATSAGVASFTVTPVAEGDYTLTATAAGLDSATADVTVGTSTRIVLTATPNSMVAKGDSIAAIRATLQDADGNAVTNQSNSDIYVTLSASGADGQLTDSYLIIRRGTSSSAGSDGHFVPALEGGTVQITGTVTSGQNYTVQGTTINLTQMVIGTASRFDLIGTGNKQPGEQTTLILRVTDRDGNPVLTGSYAFELQITTSNTRDSVVNGLPDGVTLDMSGLSPAYGGGDAAVVGRTVDGTAKINLTYDKSGIVTVKPVGISSTQVAYDDEGNPDAASSSSGFSADAKTFTYDDILGGTKGIELTWDLPSLGLKEQPYAVLNANGSTSAKLHAYLVDEKGGRRPSANGHLTLTKTGTATRGDTTATITNGVGDFSIASTTVAGLDNFTVKLDGTEIKGTTLAQTSTAKVDKPQILSAYGQSGNPTRVEISDKYLEMLISPVAATHGAVKVYSVGNNRLIYTSDVMDLSATPTIQVPKANLSTGADRYKIVINNGNGDSLASDPYPNTTDTTQMIVNAKPITIDITSVRYDAKSGQLKVSASGVSSNYGGTIQPDKLSLKKGGVVVPLSGLSSDQCPVTSSGFTCDLSSFGITPTSYSGAWMLDTADGWFVRTTSGDSASADEKTENNYITPLANITSMAVDFATGKVTLYGVNLNTGTIYLSKLWINSSANTLGTGTVTSTSPTEYTFTPSTAVVAMLKGLTGADNQLSSGDSTGWLKDSSGNENAALDTPAPVLAKVSVGYATYNASTSTLTINGSGLAGGTVDLSKLVIKNRSNVEVLHLGAVGDGVTNLTLDTNVLDGNKVVIHLGATSKGLLEANGNDGNVFVTSDATDPAANSGWFLDSKGRFGTAIRPLTYLLNW